MSPEAGECPHARGVPGRRSLWGIGGVKDIMGDVVWTQRVTFALHRSGNEAWSRAGRGTASSGSRGAEPQFRPEATPCAVWHGDDRRVGAWKRAAPRSQGPFPGRPRCPERRSPRPAGSEPRGLHRRTPRASERGRGAGVLPRGKRRRGTAAPTSDSRFGGNTHPERSLPRP